MSMIDYLLWRGDLRFEQSEFCEVDNLVLCYLTYVNLDGIAPEIGEGTMTVRKLSDRFFLQHSHKELEKDKSFIRLAPYVMKAMADTERFGDAMVRNYVNKIDLEKMLQFAAIEIILGDGTIFVAYRGTDDTIVGWKEDFYLSKGEILAEKEAVTYLNNIESKKPLRIGGHSKGGNLAIYAAANCKPQIQGQILEIYNNDGPGFTKEFLESPGLFRIRSKIQSYIPESSVIGMLLEHVVEPTIIRSTQKGVMQHDGMSWEVRGNRFLYCEKLSNFSEIVDDVISKWLAEVEDEKRNQTIDDLFAVLEATQAKTLTELQEGGMKNVRIIIKEIESMDSESKEVLQELLKAFFHKVPSFLGISNMLNKERKE